MERKWLWALLFLVNLFTDFVCFHVIYLQLNHWGSNFQPFSSSLHTSCFYELFVVFAFSGRASKLLKIRLRIFEAKIKINCIWNIRIYDKRIVLNNYKHLVKSVFKSTYYVVTLSCSESLKKCQYQYHLVIPRPLKLFGRKISTAPVQLFKTESSVLPTDVPRYDEKIFQTLE